MTSLHSFIYQKGGVMMDEKKLKSILLEVLNNVEPAWPRLMPTRMDYESTGRRFKSCWAHLLFPQ